MNPILLLCGIPSSVQAEIQSRGKNAIPGITIQFLNTLEEVSRYLITNAPFEDRDYPAPHFMILHIAAGQFDPETLSELKKREEFYRIPIILMAEDADKASLKEAFQWLYAAVVKTPSDLEEKINLVVQTAGYWSEIVKLPLI